MSPRIIFCIVASAGVTALAFLPAPQLPLARRGANSVARLRAATDSEDGVAALRKGLVNQEFAERLNEGSTKECVSLLRNASALIDLDLAKGSTLLEGVSRELLLSAEPDDADLDFVYEELRSRGVLRAFGYLGNEALPEKRRDMSPVLLESLTNMSMSALTPGQGDNSWFLTGIALCALEFAGAAAYGVDPLQTVIPATLGLFLADRVLLGGAAIESATRLLLPGYASKIVKHEAGHFLIAYLLGCPVQGCVLDPWEVRKYAAFAQGGTIFADPRFTRQMRSGQLTRSSIDRFSIILMAGIAAEAVANGKAEGGLADENALISILSTITPPFNLEQIRKQARWAAVQAVLLIKEHQPAYEALVAALSAGEPLGRCVASIETALASSPLPGEQRGALIGGADGGQAGRELLPRGARLRSSCALRTHRSV